MARDMLFFSSFSSFQQISNMTTVHFFCQNFSLKKPNSLEYAKLLVVMWAKLNCVNTLLFPLPRPIQSLSQNVRRCVGLSVPSAAFQGCIGLIIRTLFTNITQKEGKARQVTGFVWYQCYYPHTLRDSVSPVCGTYRYLLSFFYGLDQKSQFHNLTIFLNLHRQAYMQTDTQRDITTSRFNGPKQCLNNNQKTFWLSEQAQFLPYRSLFSDTLFQIQDVIKASKFLSKNHLTNITCFEHQ